jgi:hypothetical protein
VVTAFHGGQPTDSGESTLAARSLGGDAMELTCHKPTGSRYIRRPRWGDQPRLITAWISLRLVAVGSEAPRTQASGSRAALHVGP